jgi:hypothetical protein
MVRTKQGRKVRVGKVMHRVIRACVFKIRSYTKEISHISTMIINKNYITYLFCVAEQLYLHAAPAPSGCITQCYGAGAAMDCIMFLAGAGTETGAA